MPYQDLNGIHNPSTGAVAPAAWGDGVRDNQEFFIDPPVCSVFHSTTQSTTTSTFLDLAANSELFDNDAMHSTVTNNSRITAQTAGRYLITITLTFATHTTGSRVVAYRVNDDVSEVQVAAVPAATININTVVSATIPLVLAVGDFVEAAAWQNSGGNLNVTLDNFTAVFLTR